MLKHVKFDIKKQLKDVNVHSILTNIRDDVYYELDYALLVYLTNNNKGAITWSTVDYALTDEEREVLNKSFEEKYGPDWFIEKYSEYLSVLEEKTSNKRYRVLNKNNVKKTKAVMFESTPYEIKFINGMTVDEYNYYLFKKINSQILQIWVFGKDVYRKNIKNKINFIMDYINPKKEHEYIIFKRIDDDYTSVGFEPTTIKSYVRDNYDLSINLIPKRDDLCEVLSILDEVSSGKDLHDDIYKMDDILKNYDKFDKKDCIKEDNLVFDLKARYTKYILENIHSYIYTSKMFTLNTPYILWDIKNKREKETIVESIPIVLEALSKVKSFKKAVVQLGGSVHKIEKSFMVYDEEGTYTEIYGRYNNTFKRTVYEETNQELVKAFIYGFSKSVYEDVFANRFEEEEARRFVNSDELSLDWIPETNINEYCLDLCATFKLEKEFKYIDEKLCTRIKELGEVLSYSTDYENMLGGKEDVFDDSNMLEDILAGEESEDEYDEEVEDESEDEIEEEFEEEENEE